MVTLRVQLEPAFVLHSRPYRESSVLLEVFSQSHGRIGLVARGVRSAKSKLRGDLQPFRPLRISWSSSGELGTLTAVEVAGSPYTLNGVALYSGFYLNELLVRLLARQDPHPHLYTNYRRILPMLGEREASLESSLRIFEKHLLNEIGYGLLLDYDAVSGDPVQAELFYDYHLEDGPVLVKQPAAQGFIFQGASLLALEQEDLDDPRVRKDAKRLMRAALKLYLGSQPLKSRELIASLKN